MERIQIILYKMEEKELVLLNIKNMSNSVGKIRFKNDNYILKLYDKGEKLKILKYIGKSENRNNVKYKEIV